MITLHRIYDRVALDVLPDLLTQRTTGLAASMPAAVLARVWCAPMCSAS